MLATSFSSSFAWLLSFATGYLSHIILFGFVQNALTLTQLLHQMWHTIHAIIFFLSKLIAPSSKYGYAWNMFFYVFRSLLLYAIGNIKWQQLQKKKHQKNGTISFRIYKTNWIIVEGIQCDNWNFHMFNMKFIQLKFMFFAPFLSFLFIEMMTTS